MKPIGTILSNNLLTFYTPTGIGHETALSEKKPVGTKGSIQLAKEDESRFNDTLIARIEQAAALYTLPPAVLAAIASRETHVGLLLDKKGFGDHGHGYGFCQVDKRSHPIAGLTEPDCQEHWNQAAFILNSYWIEIYNIHTKWRPARQLQGAIAAYNVGIKNVQTLDGMDIGTTHNDYSNDVWARALYYAEITQ